MLGGKAKKMEGIVLNFNKKIPSTKILESLQLAESVFNTCESKNKNFPDFSDMKVYIPGPSSGTYEKMSSEKPTRERILDAVF